MSYLKRSITASMLIALCVVFPMVFHTVPYAGRTLLPMHIPVLLAGLICGPLFGFIVGATGPLLSHLFTQMPPSIMVAPMMIELATYGLVAGVMINIVRTHRLSVDIYISLIVAMLVGRVVAGIAQVIYFFEGTYVLSMWTTAYFITAFPGIIIQLLLVPSLIIALEREKVIPIRYPASVNA